MALAHDADADVRKLVCQGFVALMQMVPERLQPCLRDVVQYMLDRNQERDSEVALESCEFWCAFCEAELTEEYFAVLRDFIPRLIPVLLTNMAYAEDDEARAARAARPVASRPLTANSPPPPPVLHQRMCWRRRRRSCAGRGRTATRT